MKSRRSVWSSAQWVCAVAGGLLAAAAGSALAQNVAGRFLTVIGDVRVLGASGDRQPARGGEVHEGETILTGAGALVQIRLADGGLLSIRAETEMKFEQFSHQGENDRESSMFISLLKGGFRSVTGLIGQLNRDGYRISTPSATIGIRGTDHEPVVVLPPPPGVMPQVPPGTYDRVYSGETFMQNRQGVIQNVSPNQVGFISIEGTAPVILPQLPPLYRAGIAPSPTSPPGVPGALPGPPDPRIAPPRVEPPPPVQTAPVPTAPAQRPAPLGPSFPSVGPSLPTRP